jgi:hypothetical protein
MQGLFPDRVRQGGRKNLENRLLHVSRLYKQRFTEPGAVGRMLRSYRSLVDDLDKADADIAAWMHERIRSTSYRFSEHYADSFLLAEAVPDNRCYICGNTLIRRELSHVLRPEIRRMELICGRCGGIEDKPDPSFSLSVALPEMLPRGATLTTHVRLVNDSDHDRVGHCLAAVRRSAEFEIGHPTAPQRVVVPAGGEAVLGFEILLGRSMPAHQYDLQAAFVSMTRIFLGRRSFWVSA